MRDVGVPESIDGFALISGAHLGATHLATFGLDPGPATT
jgi:hypothetical protein